MSLIIGRDPEKQLLAEILTSRKAELLAVYGRRRVGKTFLIRTFYAKNLAFEFTGIHNAGFTEQLDNFSKAMRSAAKTRFDRPASWSAAFDILETYLTPLLKQNKQVIFFDEFPWIHTPRSNFLQAFAHF
ncbi:AAA family ATPase [Terrimonas sp. NA20]|uniref:AAA family ATPase n=1 Tax=Terrimonas ginsenosidimutans TaxID=2908004 RepID=A0ABS9KXB6_9BACT|nr:AAA family ATPase [Terrimonas ginsenosidimutans]MCG2616984.1 AAA family ATPase [Terrimonas ginsenosidimutans]